MARNSLCIHFAGAYGSLSEHRDAGSRCPSPIGKALSGSLLRALSPESDSESESRGRV